MYYHELIYSLVIRYIKFDTFTPAAERGLPVTRVISRMALQEILARAVGEDVIMNASNVVDFVDRGNKVIKESFYVEEFSYIANNRYFLKILFLYSRKCIGRII